jgi:glucose-1-phosphatase
MTRATPRFIYFDLGNVLLHFSHDQACRQVAEAMGCSPGAVREVLFSSGLEHRYEAGEMTTPEFAEEFFAALGRRAPVEKLAHAAGAIFQINESIWPVVAQLSAAGYRLGVLSNTCEVHREYFASGRYSLIPAAFSVMAMSYELRSMKPAREIYERAAALAGCVPSEIFFTDDLAENVAGARAAGFDAVQYTTTPALVRELWDRGVRFNY